jgi:hypothetical protein
MAPKTGPLVAELMRTQEGFWDTRNFKDVVLQEDGRKVGKEGRTKDFVVSSLSNCAWPMLVGGVQVRDEGQRKWLKTRLCDIYELSGFATAVYPLALFSLFPATVSPFPHSSGDSSVPRLPILFMTLTVDAR